MKLQVIDVGEKEFPTPKGDVETHMARQWTLILDDYELSHIVQDMAARVELKSGIPTLLILGALMRKGFDPCPNIKQQMPIFAQLIEEMRRLEQLDKVES